MKETKSYKRLRGYALSGILLLLILVGTAGAVPFSGPVLSQDGSKMYTPVYKYYYEHVGYVSVTDTATNTIIKKIDFIYEGSNFDYPNGLALSPDGKQLYVRVDDSMIYIIDTETDEIIIKIFAGVYAGIAHSIYFSPSGGKAYVTFPNTLLVIDTGTYDFQTFQYIYDNYWEMPVDISFSDDGKYVYVTWRDGTIYTFDADTNAILNIENPRYLQFTTTQSGLTVNFNGLGEQANIEYTPPDTIKNWSWDFGDGSTSTEQNTTHTYSQAGTYNVKLVGDTIFGYAFSYSKSIEVIESPTSVPEFPTIAVPIAAILGLIIIFGRRKE